MRKRFGIIAVLLMMVGLSSCCWPYYHHYGPGYRGGYEHHDRDGDRGGEHDRDRY